MKKYKWLIFLLFIGWTSQLFAAVCGNVNSDDAIDIVDALLIAQFYVGLSPADFDPAAGDVNGDNAIDIVDALLIAQYYVGLITEFPGCVPIPTPSTPGPAETYNPCPLPPELRKIMASGDSITMGARSTNTGGYRVPLFRLILENQNSATFVGPSGAGPETVDGVPFPENHDGHSGYIIDTINTRKGLLPLMKENLGKFTPHIILLMIGTNDINSQIDLPNAPARLAGLIDLIIETAPETLLVVAKLIPTRSDSLNNQVQDFNNALTGIVSERAEAGSHILMVDMYNAFTVNPKYKTDWLYDDLHPNDAGYAVMANTWYNAIGELLY